MIDFGVLVKRIKENFCSNVIGQLGLCYPSPERRSGLSIIRKRSGHFSQN